MTPQEELKALRAERNKKQLSAQEELKQLRSSQSIERLKSFDELIKDSPTQDEQMFDYEKGARGGLRAKLSFMETTEEKENFLRNRVGEDGYTKDSKGSLALTEVGQAKEGMEPIGKNLIIDEKGFSLRDISDLAGLAPETVGSVVGGIIGAPGLITGAAGAAAGAAVGQTVEEGIESLLGLQKQTGAEVAKDVGKEAALAGTIDLITVGTFKAVRGLIGQAGKGANLAARGLGQQQRQLGQEQAELGLKIMDEEVPGIPSYEAVGLNPAISRASQIARAISGDEQRAVQNVSFALNKKKKLLEEAGVKIDPDTSAPVSGTFDNLKQHLKLEDGSEIATDYDTFAEAFQAAQLINKADDISTNKKQAWRLREVRKGSVKLNKNEEFDLINISTKFVIVII